MKIIQIAVTSDSADRYPQLVVLSDTGLVFISTLFQDENRQPQWVQIKLPNGPLETAEEMVNRALRGGAKP